MTSLKHLKILLYFQILLTAFIQSTPAQNQTPKEILKAGLSLSTISEILNRNSHLLNIDLPIKMEKKWLNIGGSLIFSCTTRRCVEITAFNTEENTISMKLQNVQAFSDVEINIDTIVYADTHIVKSLIKFDRIEVKLKIGNYFFY